jgi:D-alanine--D-alanine ligase
MMGGRSAEREVSIKSGSAVLGALRAKGYDACALEVKDQTEGEIVALVRGNQVDIVFVAMHGGFGEGGDLQHILEKNSILFTGPKELASRLAMDKIASRELFKKARLRVPRYRKIKKEHCPLILAFMHYPIVIKPASEGSSIGVSFVDTPRQLRGALSLAFQYGETALAEEFIHGWEITVSVLDGRPLPVVEIIPKKRFFDFQAKYEMGLTDYVVPADLHPEIAHRAQADAVLAYHALGCRHFSRVDMILKKGREPYILEVNTIPGMTATSLFPKAAHAADISFEDLCATLLDLAWRDNGKE